MADYLTTTAELTAIANAIREKGGTEDPLAYPTGFVSAIEDINVGAAIKHKITITKAGSSTKYYFTLNDDTTRHYALNEEVEFTVGDSIRLYAGGYFSHKVYVDDVQVYSTSNAPLTYDYQLPNHDISVVLGDPGSSASFKIVFATKGIIQDGIYDVLGYARADVKVGGYTATITNSTNYYSPIKVNGTGTSYYKDGATFKFYDGDTLQIYLGGTHAGGVLYLNGTQIASGDSTNYTWTPPVYCDIGIEIVEGSVSHVYVTTEILNVTTNGSYPIPGYGYVNVSV